MDLAEGLVGGDPDSGGKVEGTEGMGAEAGKGEAVGVANGLMEPVRASVSLVAKEEGVSGVETYGPEGRGGMGREEPDTVRKSGGHLEDLPRGVTMDIKLIPVVHAAATKVAILEGKPEFTDEVETGPGEGAEAADVSGVLGDFRFKEDYLERRDHDIRT